MGKLYTNATANGVEVPLQLWKETVTVAAGATTATAESDFPMVGVVVEAWIKPVTLTAAAVIKLCDLDDGLATPDYIIDYTVPDPAVESHDLLALKGKRVLGTLSLSVSGATAGDSFDIYVLVDPYASAWTVDGSAPQNLIANSTEADQALTVDDTVGGVQFAAFAPETTHVFIDCQGYDVRFTLDGSDPTTDNGHIMQDGQSAIWAKDLATAAKFIRDGDSSAVVHASQLRVL